jgi:hypothetical protein
VSLNNPSSQTTVLWTIYKTPCSCPSQLLGKALFPFLPSQEAPAKRALPDALVSKEHTEEYTQGTAIGVNKKNDFETWMVEEPIHPIHTFSVINDGKKVSKAKQDSNTSLGRVLCFTRRIVP